MAKQIPRKSRRVISAVHLNKDESGELTLNLTHEYQWRTGSHTYFANGEPAKNAEPPVGTIAIAKTYHGDKRVIIVDSALVTKEDVSLDELIQANRLRRIIQYTDEKLPPALIDQLNQYLASRTRSPEAEAVQNHPESD